LGTDQPDIPANREITATATGTAGAEALRRRPVEVPKLELGNQVRVFRLERKPCAAGRWRFPSWNLGTRCAFSGSSGSLALPASNRQVGSPSYSFIPTSSRAEASSFNAWAVTMRTPVSMNGSTFSPRRQATSVFTAR